MLCQVGNEYHFHVEGNRGGEKWFRIPDGLHQELVALKTESPYVFAAYTEKVRLFYERGSMPWQAKRVGPDFKPGNVADWFYERLLEWSATLPAGRITTHIFRKTSMQYADEGEDAVRERAADLRVSPAGMTNHYFKKKDEQRRQRSNRVVERILAGLRSDVAERYGHVETERPSSTSPCSRSLRCGGHCPQPFLPLAEGVLKEDKEVWMALAGAWKDDPYVEAELQGIYRGRGRPMTEQEA